tara:strand:- start:1490 stop:1858 length:369 start_codon:yes stop_codon:yes gene_type:complete
MNQTFKKMSKTSNYMSKIDKYSFSEWKEKKGKYNGRLMFQLWVDYLSVEKNFNDFNCKITEDEKIRTKDDITQYKIVDLDSKNWNKFMLLCRNNNMYANDLINILVKKFNNKGYCIETTLKV